MKQTWSPQTHRLDEAQHREPNKEEASPVANEDWRRIHAAVERQRPGEVVIVECGKSGKRHVKALGRK